MNLEEKNERSLTTEYTVTEHATIDDAIAAVADIPFKIGSVLTVQTDSGPTYKVLKETNDGTGIAGNGGFWCEAKQTVVDNCSYLNEAALKSDVNLKVGDVVWLLGKTQGGDGTSHLRKIVTTSNTLDKITLDNGLFAEVVPNSFGVNAGEVSKIEKDMINDIYNISTGVKPNSDISCESHIRMQPGESYTIKLSGQLAAQKFSYTSSNPLVAQVDASGIVTSLSEGECSIKITDNIYPFIYLNIDVLVKYDGILVTPDLWSSTNASTTQIHKSCYAIREPGRMLKVFLRMIEDMGDSSHVPVYVIDSSTLKCRFLDNIILKKEIDPIENVYSIDTSEFMLSNTEYISIGCDIVKMKYIGLGTYKYDYTSGMDGLAQANMGEVCHKYIKYTGDMYSRMYGVGANDSTFSKYLKHVISEEVSPKISNLEKGIENYINTEISNLKNDVRSLNNTFLISKGEIGMIVGCGQSLGEGSGSRPLQTTTQMNNAWMFNQGMKLRFPVGEKYQSLVPHIEQKNNENEETPGGGCAETILRNSPSGSNTLSSCCAIGGMKISQLSKGSTAYAGVLDDVVHGKMLSEAKGLKFKFLGITWTQGEYDQLNAVTSRESYLAAIKQLYADLKKDLFALGIDTSYMKCVMYQTSRTSNNDNPTIALAQLDACLSDPDTFKLATPVYHLKYMDGWHIDGPSSKLLGCHYGDAFVNFYDTYSGAIVPVNHFVCGAVIRIKYNAKHILQKSPPNVQWTDINHGISVLHGDQNILTSVDIAGGEVILVCSQDVSKGDIVKVGTNVNNLFCTDLCEETEKYAILSSSNVKLDRWMCIHEIVI